MAAGRDRIYISKESREILNKLRESHVLDLDVAENKEAFLLAAAVAVGADDSLPLTSRDGLLLYTAVKTSDRALIASVLLGDPENTEDLNSKADFDRSVQLCEEFAEAGFRRILKKYNDAECDREVFEKTLLEDLKLLYAKNVAASSSGSNASPAG